MRAFGTMVFQNFCYQTEIPYLFLHRIVFYDLEFNVSTLMLIAMAIHKNASIDF